MNYEAVSQICFIITISYFPLKKKIGIKPYRVAMDIRHRKDLHKIREIYSCHSAAAAVIPTTNNWIAFPGGTSGKELACQCRKHTRRGFNPGSGRSPGAGYGNPLQYSCLENPMDRGAHWAKVSRVAKSRTRLKGQQPRTHTQVCGLEAHLLDLKSRYTLNPHTRQILHILSFPKYNIHILGIPILNQ